MRERGGRIVEDMCYGIRLAAACVDYSDHHTIVDTGKGIFCERRVV